MAYIAQFRLIVRFSRLHTILGTIVASFAIFTIVVAGIDNISLGNLQYFLVFLIMALCLNLFVVGINQIFDLSIDKINKPGLPLASGDMTLRNGWTIIIMAAILGVGIAVTNAILLATAILIIIIGVSYSVPPIRLRNNFLPASLLILAGRGILLNVSSFLYFSSQVNDSLIIPHQIWFILIFVSLHTIVISIFKDLPDTDGDAEHTINTLPNIVSLTFSYVLPIFIMIVNYALVIFFLDVAGIGQTVDITRQIITVYHIGVLMGLLLSLVNYRAILSSQKLIQMYYKIIWVLLYIQYFVFAYSFSLTI